MPFRAILPLHAAFRVCLPLVRREIRALHERDFGASLSVLREHEGFEAALRLRGVFPITRLGLGSRERLGVRILRGPTRPGLLRQQLSPP